MITATRTRTSTEGYPYEESYNLDTGDAICLLFHMPRGNPRGRYKVRDLVTPGDPETTYGGLAAARTRVMEIVADYIISRTNQLPDAEPHSIRTVRGGLPTLGERR